MKFPIEKEMEEYFGKPLDQVRVRKRGFFLAYDGINIEAVMMDFLPNLFDFVPKENIDIYHYTSLEGLEGILSSTSLWFTDSMFLNDTSEGTYIYTLLRDVLDSYEDEDDDFVKFKNHVFNDIIFKKIGTSYSPLDIEYKGHHFFICSFSTKKDSLSMWNYYSKSENNIGANINFSSRELVKNLDAYLDDVTHEFENIHVYRVLYDEDEQKELLRKATEGYYTLWKISKRRKEIFPDFAELIDLLRFVYKHPSFQDEQEIRFVIEAYDRSINVTMKSGELLLRSSKHGFIPYLSIPFDKNSVKQITASPNMKNYETIRFLLKKLGYSDDIKVTRSTIPWRS